jgi:glutathione synthase/RimK-type ligase-like ATP-grasp enzyme
VRTTGRSPSATRVTRTCLILTERFEPTADCLLAELRRRGIPCLRWNLDSFPADSGLSYRVDPESFSGELRCDGRSVDIAAIGSVWCRGFRPSGFPAGLSEEDQRFVQDEAQRALDALTTVLPVPWANHPHNHARANSKAAQLMVARDVGLDIPRTLISNEPDLVREFIEQSATETVYKAHSQSLNLERGKALYTGVVTDKEVERLELIRISPGVFQEYVAKSFELRVTAVGARLFSGRIESQSSQETKVDWRRRPFDIEKEPYDLPTEIADKIREFMGRFGLLYGALDFIVTPDGRFVFLEINPAGQYLWVETVTKMPITAALADLLGGACSGI